MIRPTKQKHETDARRSSPNRREIKKRKNKRNRREKSEPEARHETEERQKTKSMKTRQTAVAKLGYADKPRIAEPRPLREAALCIKGGPSAHTDPCRVVKSKHAQKPRNCFAARPNSQRAVTKGPPEKLHLPPMSHCNFLRFSLK